MRAARAEPRQRTRGRHHARTNSVLPSLLLRGAGSPRASPSEQATMTIDTRKEARSSGPGGLSFPRPGGRLVAALVALALATVGVAFAIVAFRTGAERQPEAMASNVVLPDGLGASRIAIGEDAVWALASTGENGLDVLVRIDPATDRVVATTSLAPRPWFEAAGAEAVWVGFPSSNMIQRVDTATNEVTGQIRLPGDGVTSIAADDQAVWVEVIHDRSDQGLQNLASLVRIDPRTGDVVATIPLEGLSGYDDEIAIGTGAVWVAGVNLTGPSEERGADLLRIDPITNSVSAVLPVSAFSVKAGSDAVWVTAPADGVNDSLHQSEAWVTREIDPTADEISAPTPLPGHASGVLAVTADGVWFSGYDAEGQIHPVRLQGGVFDRSVPPIDAIYTDMAFDGATGTIWIAAISGLKRVDRGKRPLGHVGIRSS